MALTLQQLEAQRDKILLEMGGPQRADGPSGMGVTFRPQAELESALDRVNAEIAKLQAQPAGTTFTITSNRGICK
jgi:hypothetical protein